MSIDSSGNLYVTDSGASIVYVIPSESGSPNPSAQYILATGVSATSSVAPGFAGSYYFTNSNYPSVYDLLVGSLALGASPVGTPVNGTVNVVFNAAETPQSIAVTTSNAAFQVGSGGTCAANTAYTAGQSCTVKVAFTPAVDGVSSSALTIAGSGGILAEEYLAGIGTGAALTVDPGTVAPIASGYTTPRGVAIDAAGNLYIADSGANTVYEVAQGSSTPVSLGSGLSAPQGVVVDGAGNVFVADTGNNRIVEIPSVSGSPSTAGQTIVISSGTSLAGSPLNAPDGITVDGAGNLYIADTGNKRVLCVPYGGGWNPSSALVLGSGFTAPSAIALDTAGDVYVADASTGDVYELQAPVTNVLQSTVATGYNTPTGLAVDPSGALFVVEEGNQKLWRVPNLSGTLTPTQALNVVGQLDASGLQIVANPYGVALDAFGNVYVTDNANAAAYQVARTSSTQSAGYVSPNTTGSALIFNVENAGNAALTFGTPYETASDTVNFDLLSGETGACASGGSVVAGTSCVIEAEFAPSDFGSFSDTLTLSSNAANSSSPAVTFTGTGAVTASTTTTLTQTSPAGPPAYDQAVTFNVTVSSASGTPVGTVSLLVDGIAKQTGTLSNSGSASFTLAGGVLSGGSHILDAGYNGGIANNTVYSGSTSSPLTVNVAAVPTATTVSYATAYVAPNSQPAGTSLVFTATVSSAFAGVPTGLVTFKITDANGTIATGTGTLQPASGGTFQATYTYANTQSPTGKPYDVESVVATYSGDENFAGSSSSTSSFDVSPAAGSVVTTESGTTITSSANSNGTITITTTSYGGWNGMVGFSCASLSLPSNARCIFSPGQVEVLASTPTASASTPPVTMSVTIDQPPQTPTASKLLWWLAAPTGLLLLFARRRLTRRGWPTLAMVLGLVLLGSSAIGLTACASGEAAYVTPAGTTTVTVVASSTPFQAGSTTTMQSCPANNPSNAPCSQTTFPVSLTVQ